MRLAFLRDTYQQLFSRLAELFLFTPAAVANIAPVNRDAGENIQTGVFLRRDPLASLENLLELWRSFDRVDGSTLDRLHVDNVKAWHRAGRLPAQAQCRSGRFA